MRRGSLIVCTLSLLLLACGGDDHAPAAGRARTTQVLATNAGQARLAVSPDGARTVVACRRCTFRDRTFFWWHAAPGTSFGAAKTLGRGVTAAVAADGSGVVASSAGSRLSVRTFDVAGRLSAPVELDRGAALDDADLSMARSGAALLTWTKRGGLYAAVRDPGSGAFAPPVKLGAFYEGVSTSQAIGTRGDAVVMFTTGDGGGLYGVHRPAGGAFGHPLDLDAEGGPGGAAIDETGRGILTFDGMGLPGRFEKRLTFFTAQVRRDSGIRPVRRLTAVGPTTEASAAAGDGQVALAIYSGSSTTLGPRPLVFSATGSSLRRAPIDGHARATGQYSAPALAIGSGGRTILGWVSPSGTSVRPVLSIRSAGGAFSRPVAIGPPAVGSGFVFEVAHGSAGTDVVYGTGPNCSLEGNCMLVAARHA